MSEWTDHVERWKDCRNCPLCDQRSNIVIARGQICPTDVLFIGEAPGASEDALGQPFKGPAGQLLDQIIERAFCGIDLRIAFTNLVCCFPREAKERGENEPSREEILACRPRLVEFVNIAKPRMIVCVGRLASDYVEHDASGKVGGVSVVSIVHPAATFPPRMVRSQAQQAIQNAIAVLRSGVEDMLASGRKFTKWEVSDAKVKSQRERLREAVRERYGTDDEIPF